VAPHSPRWIRTWGHGGTEVYVRTRQGWDCSPGHLTPQAVLPLLPCTER
jgi:hypothetical protein